MDFRSSIRYWTYPPPPLLLIAILSIYLYSCYLPIYLLIAMDFTCRDVPLDKICIDLPSNGSKVDCFV